MVVSKMMLLVFAQYIAKNPDFHLNFQIVYILDAIIPVQPYKSHEEV